MICPVCCWEEGCTHNNVAFTCMFRKYSVWGKRTFQASDDPNNKNNVSGQTLLHTGYLREIAKGVFEEKNAHAFDEDKAVATNTPIINRQRGRPSCSRNYREFPISHCSPATNNNDETELTGVNYRVNA